MQKTDEELMGECMEGDEKAIHQLFIRYKLRIFNFCLRMLSNRADAEEAAADVFLSLLKNRQSYDPSRKFSTWIFTIARNHSITLIRKRKNVFNVWFTTKGGDDNDGWDVSDTKDLSRDALVKEEIQVHVKKAIANLPEEQREAIILRQYHDFSYEEISKILDCSLDKVKILIFRAKEQMRVELVPFMKEDSQ